MQQQYRFRIPHLTRANFPASVAAIHLQAGALSLTAAIEDATYRPDTLLVRTLAHFTHVILDSIQTEAQSEAIHGNHDLQLYAFLSAIHDKFNPMSAADHEALDLKASRTILTQYEKLEQYSDAHHKMSLQIIAAAYSSIDPKCTTIKFMVRGLANHPISNIW